MEILHSELRQSPGFKEYGWMVEVSGEVQNNATEACQAEIAAHFDVYSYPTKTTVEIKALGTAYFKIESVRDFKCESYTVEVTDVEIEY